MTLFVLVNNMQTVLLIGGVSGVGKSTLGLAIQSLYGDSCYNFDFGAVYNPQSKVNNWEREILDSIHTGLSKGYELVVANSKFNQRIRRDHVLDNIHVRTVPLILRPPLLDAFHNIRNGRPEGTHITNADNARCELIDQCAKLARDDQSDILLPSNKGTVPKEYLAMLQRTELNRPLLSQNGSDPRVRWVSVCDRITPQRCVEVVRSGVSKP